MVIEANTVPGMTPSTVLFHQALAENPPIFPRDFFRSIVELARTRFLAGSGQDTGVVGGEK